MVYYEISELGCYCDSMDQFVLFIFTEFKGLRASHCWQPHRATQQLNTFHFHIHRVGRTKLH